MRTFFALELSAVEKIAIEQWREKSLPNSPNNVPPANFHITLCFNGQTDTQQLEALQKIGDSIEIEQCELHFDHMGYFTKPKITYLGVNSIPDSLMNLHLTLTDHSKGLGFSQESRPYRPHITIARKVSAPIPAPIIEPDFTVAANSFALFESMRGKQGMIYRPIFTWNLSPRLAKNR